MAPDPNQDQIAAYAAAQGQSQAALTLLATNQARNAAQSFTAWYDSGQIGAWAQQLAQFIEAVQGQSASTTDAYLSEVASLIKGSNVSPAGAVKVSGLRKGVSHTEVYGRSADQYRYARSIGKSEDEAQQTAVQTAIDNASTDVQLAQRAQAQRFMVVKKVDGYRRIIHPEESAGGSCGLCVAASSNFYHRGDLLPIHRNCKCTISPIINGIDPGHVLNQSDLKALYQQAGGSTRAKDLAKVRYVVHDNGELGPVLGQHPGETVPDLPAVA